MLKDSVIIGSSDRSTPAAGNPETTSGKRGERLVTDLERADLDRREFHCFACEYGARVVASMSIDRDAILQAISVLEGKVQYLQGLLRVASPVERISLELEIRELQGRVSNHSSELARLPVPLTDEFACAHAPTLEAFSTVQLRIDATGRACYILHYTMVALAKRIGVDRSDLYKWRTGKLIAGKRAEKIKTFLRSYAAV